MSRKKKSPTEAINDANMVPEEAYVTWGDDLDSKNSALTESSKALEEYGLIHSAHGHYYPQQNRYNNDFSNLTPDGTGSRPGLTKQAYNWFRPNEAVPLQIKPIIKRAEEVYQKVGLVKNVIDLMGDFASQGIRIVHKDQKTQTFFRNWFKKVNGKDRSERFLNNLYKTGNVVITRQTAKLTPGAAKKMYKAVSDANYRVSDPYDLKVGKREVPWVYTFIDPFYVDVVGGALASFTQNRRYEINMPSYLRKVILSPKTDAEKEIVASLPEDILAAANQRKKYPLDPEKTIVHYYKKDDWQAWAYPMVYAVMDDIMVMEKLKLADMAALDGAISNIRIFKIGNLEHKIAPTKAAASKLASILGNNVGGGTMDLVWGPDIELIESKTNVHQFLGEGKYTPHLNAIYAGLGIPPTLTGTYGAAGTTNNFISLKTLTQRLEYGRDVLTEFWNKEMTIVQQAMGFKEPAMLEFDRMDLSNEESEKALLVQLADRNLISEELLQTRFDMDPDMEKYRIDKETKAREKGKMADKAGPYHNPQSDENLKKIALQTGLATPSEVGLELKPKKQGEKTLIEMKPSPSSKKAGDVPTSLPKGDPGRPTNSPDSTPVRKERTFKPRQGAGLTIWATNAQEQISKIINPVMLEYYQKKTLRSLSSVQSQEIEEIKTQVLFKLEPFCTIDNELVIAKISENLKSSIMTSYSVWLRELALDLGRELNVDDRIQAKASYYATLKGE